MYNASHFSPGGSYASPAMAHYHGSSFMSPDVGHTGFQNSIATSESHRSAGPPIGPPAHTFRPTPWEQAPHPWVGLAPPSSLPIDAHGHHPDMRHPHSLPPVPTSFDHHSQAGHGHDQPPDAYLPTYHAAHQLPDAYHQAPDAYHQVPDANRHQHDDYQQLEEEQHHHAENHPLAHHVHPELDADKRLIEGRKANGLGPAYATKNNGFRIEGFSEGDSETDLTPAKTNVSRHYFYKSHPDGNLYRGWAIGLQSGFRQLILTLCVIIVQLIGPVLMCQWAWEALQEQGNPVSLYNHWKDHGFKVTELELKLLGTVLMVLIYFNADQLLSNKDCQTIRLIQLYPKTLHWKWIVIDAFCNSWVIAMLAPATPALLWSTGSRMVFLIGLSL